MNNYGKILSKKQRLRNAIMGSEIISRQDLIQKTGLNYRSVVAYTEELKQQGLIAESILENPGGRPAIHYLSCSKQIYCLAIILYRKALTVGAADINSDMLYAERIELPPGAAVNEMIRLVFNAMEDLRKRIPRKILGGIELCRIPYDHHNIYYEGMKELYMTMCQNYQVPLALHTNHDVLLLRMMHNFNITDRVVMLIPEDEISLSMVENRQVNTEMEHYLRRFKHHQLSMKCREKCYCGKNRCVESLLTHVARLKRYNCLRGINRYYPNISEATNNLSLQAVSGDPHARQVLKETGQLFAEAMWFLKNDLQAEYVLVYFKDPIVLKHLYEAYKQISGEDLPLFSMFRSTLSDVLSACMEVPLAKLIS